MQFKIHFDEEINPSLYEDYCEFILESAENSIRELINPLKYHVREKSVIESPVMRWVKIPSTINLTQYVENCLEMVRDRGEYVIRVREDQRVSGSHTKVKTLIRLLEYGNERIPAYPVVRKVLMYYSQVYRDLLVEFIRERMLQ